MVSWCRSAAFLLALATPASLGLVGEAEVEDRAVEVPPPLNTSDGQPGRYRLSTPTPLQVCCPNPNGLGFRR